MPDVAPEITIIAEFVAKEGAAKKLHRVLERAVEPTRLEDGCILYRLHRSVDAPARFVFYERWASREALDAHSETQHIQQLREGIDGIVMHSEVVRYEQVAPDPSAEEADAAEKLADEESRNDAAETENAFL